MKLTRLSLLLPLLTALCIACSGSESRTADSDTSAASTAADSVAKPQKISFAFTGDMMLGTDFPDNSKGQYLPADSGRNLLVDALDVLQRVDLACGNLEGVLGKANNPKHCNNPSLCFTFRMPEYMADRLKEAGFDYMNLANNHMADFHKEGLQTSFDNLKRVGIPSAGATDIAPYTVVDHNGLKVGFTGFSTSTECPSIHDYDQLRSILAEMRPKCDIIVVAIHAGGEGAGYTHVPRKAEVFHGWPRGDVYKFAHTAIDNGADIIWGHGPHVVRAAEVYKDRLILYSLGNFCTPYRMGISGLGGQAALAEINVDNQGRFLDGQIHSFIQQRGLGPRADSNNAVARQMRALTEADFPDTGADISPTGRITPARR